MVRPRKRKSKKNKVKIYTIIVVNHKKHKYIVKSVATESEAYRLFHQLLKDTKKLIFPMRFNNENHVMVRSDYELVIIKCRDENEPTVNKIKDDNGMYVNYEASNTDWIIVDRAPYEVEETFWIYGYHPRIQRKTFQWVFDNFILPNEEHKSKFKEIYAYNNKICIDCEGKMEMVICKTREDSARFYNLLEEWCKKRNMKYVSFMGSNRGSNYSKYWFDKIQQLTNWDRLKINRPSTRP